MSKFHKSNDVSLKSFTFCELFCEKNVTLLIGRERSREHG